jgi:hypothetical protein
MPDRGQHWTIRELVCTPGQKLESRRRASKPHHRLIARRSFSYGRGEKVLKSRNEHCRNTHPLATTPHLVGQTRSSPESSCLSRVVIPIIMISQPYEHFVWNSQ